MRALASATSRRRWRACRGAAASGLRAAVAAATGTLGSHLARCRWCSGQWAGCTRRRCAKPVPGAIAFAAAAALLPGFLLMPLLGIAAPLSGLAGLYYAWRHNQTGQRTGLFSDANKRAGQ